MCNVSYGIEKRGEARGEARGIEIAIVNSVRKLMKNFNISLEQALKGLEIPESEYPKYRKLIAE